jgi:hypothetical protein
MEKGRCLSTFKGRQARVIGAVQFGNCEMDSLSYRYL